MAMVSCVLAVVPRLVDAADYPDRPWARNTSSYGTPSGAFGLRNSQPIGCAKSDASIYSGTINDGSLGGAGNIVLGGTITRGNGVLSINATLDEGSGLISRSLSVMPNLGCLTLSGTNSYAGGTTISSGKLVVNNVNKSALTVQNGGTLCGTGTVRAVTMDAGAILAAGNSSGTLTFDSALTLSCGSVNSMEISSGGLFLPVEPIFNGTLISANLINPLELLCTNLYSPSFFGLASDIIFSGSSSFVLPYGGSFTLIDPLAVSISDGGSTFDPGNFSSYMVTAIPEPASAVMLLFGAGVGMAVHRARRSALRR
jgi:autotransporter-associated beta strand protein